MAESEKPFKLTWPEGAKLSMDERSFLEMRKGLEIQFKHMIYKQPGFRFFHSIGNTNFFQRFKTDDGIDFGVLHVYWDKDAENMIEYVDENGNLTPHSKQGDWRHRWLKHEDGYPVVAPRGNSIMSEDGWRKVLQIHADKLKESLEKSATKIAKEKIKELKKNPKNKLQEFLENFEEEENLEDFETYNDGDEKKFLLN